MLISGALICLASNWLIQVLFGASFACAKYAVFILFPGTVLLSISWLVGSFFEGIGKPEILMKANIVSFVINISLNLLLVPKFGFLGAAAASTSAYLSLALFLTILFSGETGLPWYSIFQPVGGDFSPGKLLADLGFERTVKA
jgi:O-antigen/teichoic acid export membrane protein